MVDDDEDELTWEETEDDSTSSFVSLVDPKKVFPSAEAMLAHDMSNGLDLVGIAKQFQLDFYGAIRLVNYLRSHAYVKEGLSLEDFQSDEFLKPVLEDDALLTSLDDVFFARQRDQQQEGHSQYQHELDQVVEQLASATQIVRDALEADELQQQEAKSFVTKLQSIVEETTTTTTTEEHDDDTSSIRALKRDIVDAKEQLELVRKRAADLLLTFSPTTAEQ